MSSRYPSSFSDSIRKRKAAWSSARKRKLSAWRCRCEVSDSGVRATSVTSNASGSPAPFCLAGASPPHSESSGRTSVVPSPSQLCSMPTSGSDVDSKALVGDVSGWYSATEFIATSVSKSSVRAGMSACASPNSSCSKVSPSTSRKGLSSSICSTSCDSSSVDSCNNRMDCCNWGVSARCCETRSDRPGFITS